jgi:hypothetical protein
MRAVGAGVQRVVRESVKRRLSLCSSEPAGKEESGAEAEESPLLENVTRERLVKIQQSEKTACAAVICGDQRWRYN